MIEIEVEKSELLIKKEHNFSKEEDKWRIISDIISTRIDPSYYSL